MRGSWGWWKHLKIDTVGIAKEFRGGNTALGEAFHCVMRWDHNRVGQLDLHFAHDTIHATLILEADLSVSAEEELLTQIDEDIVSSYLPSFDRNDFLVTVFRGEEISSYTDSQSLEDDDDE